MPLSPEIAATISSTISFRGEIVGQIVPLSREIVATISSTISLMGEIVGEIVGEMVGDLSSAELGRILGSVGVNDSLSHLVSAAARRWDWP